MSFTWSFASNNTLCCSFIDGWCHFLSSAVHRKPLWMANDLTHHWVLRFYLVIMIIYNHWAFIMIHAFTIFVFSSQWCSRQSKINFYLWKATTTTISCYGSLQVCFLQTLLLHFFQIFNKYKCIVNTNRVVTVWDSYRAVTLFTVR